jgi:hypothetical protein
MEDTLTILRTLSKRQKEVLYKLALGYETFSADKIGTTHLFKGNDNTIIHYRTTDHLLVARLIDTIDVSTHSTGYRLTDKGKRIVEYMVNGK